MVTYCATEIIPAWLSVIGQFFDIMIVASIDLFTDTAVILNSIVLTEKLWAAEGAITGKFIVYTAFGINFYCLSLIFHNKYYKRYIFPSRYLAVVPMVIEKLLLKVITPQNYFSSAPWASHNFLGIQDGRRIGKKVY